MTERQIAQTGASTGGPETSIIIVNYNAGPLLARCVEAALASNAKVEVIAVDNASSDGSVEGIETALANDNRLQIIRNSKNLGFSAANNIGAAKAAGDFLLFLNPDCVIRQDTVSRMVKTMQEHPEAGMAGALIQNEDGSEQRGCRRNIPTLKTAFARAFGMGSVLGVEDFNLTGSPLPEKPVYVEAVSGAFMFTRREAVEAVGPMDEGYFFHCEDLDWCLRFAKAGYKIVFTPDAAVVHYQGTCSAPAPIRTEYHKSRGMARFYRKFHGAGPMFWFVSAGIWLRFMGFTLLSLARGHRA